MLQKIVPAPLFFLTKLCWFSILLQYFFFGLFPPILPYKDGLFTLPALCLPIGDDESESFLPYLLSTPSGLPPPLLSQILKLAGTQHQPPSGPALFSWEEGQGILD